MMLLTALRTFVGEMRLLAAACMVIFFIAAVVGIVIGKPSLPLILPVMLGAMVGWVAFGWRS
jgi:hypothetical protein